MRIQLEELRSRSKYISEQRHPTLPLIIWNYTHTCQFDKAWDAYTRVARGLITDLDGHIVARPFPKFFNLNEHEETKIENLPIGNQTIYEKLDGSLGIQYYWDDEVTIATRGSFNSDQATWATEWIRDRGLKKKDFNENWTYLYEIIYPENRIVVDYGGRSELVLLAVIDNETGDDIEDWEGEAIRLGLSHAKQFKGNIYEMLEHVKTMKDDEEGFVVRYTSPKSMRLKIKGEEYTRLHRLITGFSTKSLWECLMNGQDLTEVLDRVPDEFYQWVKDKEKELKKSFWEREQMAIGVLGDCKRLSRYSGRKEQALLITSVASKFNAPWLPGVVFAMLDSKPHEKIIWKQLKPKYELPFKKDIDS